MNVCYPVTFSVWSMLLLSAGVHQSRLRNVILSHLDASSVQSEQDAHIVLYVLVPDSG